MKRREETLDQWIEREAAQQSLGARFWRDWMVGGKPTHFDSMEAFGMIVSAVNDQYPPDPMLYYPPVRPEDALDALQVAPEVVRRIEYAELELIKTARAAGAPWTVIGARYGYQTRPGMQARRRYRNLRKQCRKAPVTITVKAGLEMLIHARMAYADETYTEATRAVETILNLMTRLDLNYNDTQVHFDTRAAGSPTAITAYEARNQ